MPLAKTALVNVEIIDGRIVSGLLLDQMGVFERIHTADP